MCAYPVSPSVKWSEVNGGGTQKHLTFVRVQEEGLGQGERGEKRKRGGREGRRVRAVTALSYCSG